MAYLEKFAIPKIKKLCNHDVELSIQDIRNNVLGGYTFDINSNPKIDDEVKFDANKIILEYVKQAIRFLGEDSETTMVYLDKNYLKSINESRPYDETVNDGKSVRVFKNNIDESELKWHRDKETRVVEVLSSDSWKIQLDNELPIELEVGGKYLIPEGVFHRVIKGNGDLKVSISFIY